jgi:phosphatidylglycerophosphate synthase
LTAILPAGSNHTRLWGLTPRERLARIAARQDLEFAHGAGGGPLVANLDYVFDPAWVRLIAERPNHLVTHGGVPVLAHVEDLETRLAVTLAMAEGRAAAAPGLTILPFEESGSAHTEELRKRERPFLGRLAPDTVRALERESFAGAYPGVTDLMTKYLLPEGALVLTRLAAGWRITPNQVTTVGALMCIAATMLFASGWYWTGLLAAFGFMVLDTVDGTLARCTIGTSWWGTVLDAGIDLVHPPFWWWAWGAGLYAYGRPLEPSLFGWALAILVGGHLLQRLIERAFAARFAISIHAWRPFDSRFRLIAARRNPNMLILLAFLLAGRPDWGLLAMAGWTAVSLLVHVGQLRQAVAVRARGGEVRSWLA